MICDQTIVSIARSFLLREVFEELLNSNSLKISLSLLKSGDERVKSSNR